MTNEKRRTWADILVLVASLWAIGEAIWGPALFSQGSQDRGASTTYVLSVVAGTLGLLGVGLAQKKAMLGRVLVGLAGVLVLVGPFTYRQLPPLPLAFAVITGVILLGAATFVGPVPPPRGHI